MRVTYRRAAQLASKRLGRPISESMVRRAVERGTLRAMGTMEGTDGAVIYGIEVRQIAAWDPPRRGEYAREKKSR